MRIIIFFQNEMKTFEKKKLEKKIEKNTHIFLSDNLSFVPGQSQISQKNRPN